MPRTAITTRKSATQPVYNLNTALFFDGETNTVVIPDNNAYSYATTNALSISVWINPSTLSFMKTEGTGYVNFLSKNDYPNQREWAFRMYSTGNSENRNNRISFYMFALATSLGDGAYFEDEVIPGQWIHLVGTVDSSKNIRLYKNGVLRNMFPTSALAFANGTSNVYVGASNSSDNSFFYGSIDDIRIFNYALSDAQVQDLYNKNTITTTGQVGWFKFDDRLPTVATDSSSIANNGTITGATYIQSFIKTRNKITNFTVGPKNSYSQVNNSRVFRKKLIGGKSLILNGSTQYAYITNANQIGLNIGVYDFMVGGSFKITNSSAIQFLMGKYSGTGYALSNASNVGFDLLWRGDVAGKPLQIRLTDGTTNVTCATSTGELRLADGRWHTIAVAVSRTGGAQFFIDGNKVSQQNTNTALLTLTNTGPLFIGTRTDASTAFTNGLVQNVFYYVYSDGIPTNIYQIVYDIYANNKYNTSGLISVWTLNNTANDSISSNNLTLSGSPTYSSDTRIGVRTSVV